MKKATSKTIKSIKRPGKQKITQTKWQIMVQKYRRAPLMWLGLISSLVGIAGFLFLIYPRISVIPGSSLDSHNPFQTPFILKNDGYLSIYDIEYSLGADKIEDKNHNVYHVGSISGGSKMNTIRKLTPNKTSSLFISSTVVMPPDFITYADSYIHIKYRPFLVPFSFNESIRFKAERKNTGEYIWLEDYSKES